MISVAFWLGHNPQLLYMRRLLFQDRVRVRASTSVMVRISFIIRVRDRVRVRVRVRDRVRVRVRVRDRVRGRVRGTGRGRDRVRFSVHVTGRIMLGLKLMRAAGRGKCVIEDSAFHSCHRPVLSLSPLMTRK